MVLTGVRFFVSSAEIYCWGVLGVSCSCRVSTGDCETETAEGGRHFGPSAYVHNRLGYDVTNECAYCVNCGKSFLLCRRTLLLDEMRRAHAVCHTGGLGAVHGERQLAPSGSIFAIAQDTRSVMNVIIFVNCGKSLAFH